MVTPLIKNAVVQGFHVSKGREVVVKTTGNTSLSHLVPVLEPDPSDCIGINVRRDFRQEKKKFHLCGPRKLLFDVIAAC